MVIKNKKKNRPRGWWRMCDCQDLPWHFMWLFFTLTFTMITEPALVEIPVQLHKWATTHWFVLQVKFYFFCSYWNSNFVQLCTPLQTQPQLDRWDWLVWTNWVPIGTLPSMGAVCVPAVHTAYIQAVRSKGKPENVTVVMQSTSLRMKPKHSEEVDRTWGPCCAHWTSFTVLHSHHPTCGLSGSNLTLLINTVFISHFLLIVGKQEEWKTWIHSLDSTLHLIPTSDDLKKSLRVRGVAEAVECLPSKLVALSSNSGTDRKKTRNLLLFLSLHLFLCKMGMLDLMLS
jgi:hypothetical protein